MKDFALLLSLIVGQVIANGNYHQEYNYKASSSSFRNNELQHRNDDEAYYSKDGDLEGRFTPKVNSHKQHSEYVNPKLKYGGGYPLSGGYANGYGQSSYGHMNTHDQMLGGGGGGGGYGGAMGASYAGGQNYQSSYQQQSQSSNYQTYGVNSNLRQVTQRLRMEIERELQAAIEEQCRRTLQMHNNRITQSQIDADIRYLEEILRRNLTSRMDEVLRSHYGEQGMRDSQSYSIINGRLQSTPNYHTQELEDLRRQFETDLIGRLQEGVRTQYESHRITTTTHQQVNGGMSVVQPYPIQAPYQPQSPPYQPQPPRMPIPPLNEKPYYGPVVANPDSLTTIGTRVQQDLNIHLDKILRDTERRYFGVNSGYHAQNFDMILRDLQEELRSNITVMFQQQLRSNQHTNFNADHLATLKNQIERNLIEKLNRSFNEQRNNYYRTVNVIHGSNYHQGNHFQGAGYYPSSSNQAQVDWHNIQQRLQEDLSRQLQHALMQQQYRHNQMNYQTSLQHLTAEMNRNLTRQLEDRLAQYQGYAQSHNYNSQLANMRNQLQNALNQELQRGLQQSYSSYSSWSSSSSSHNNGNANYRPVRGYDTIVHQPYTSGIPGEDCMMGDDPSAYNQDDDLSQRTEDMTQQLEDQSEDMTQQLEDHDLNRYPKSQQIVDESAQSRDFQQQTEDLTDQQHQLEPLTQSRPQPPIQQQQVIHPQTTQIKRFYIIDSAGRRIEVDEAQYEEHLKNSATMGQHWQSHTTTTTHHTQTSPQSSKRFFITDSTGKRTEVTESEFNRQIELMKLHPEQAAYTTRKYYVNEGSRTSQEINPYSWTTTATSNQTTRKYYITGSDGVRREVDEAEYRRQVELMQIPTQSHVTRRYYITESNGIRREVSEAEFQQLIKTDQNSQSTITRKYYVSEGSDGSTQQVTPGQYRESQGRLTQIPDVTTHVTRKYYITDTSGTRREVSEAEFQRLIKPTVNQSTVTHKYYVSEGTEGTHEVTPAQYLQSQSRIPSESQVTTSHVTRKYYITYSNGIRRQVTEAEFQEYMKSHPEYSISDGTDGSTQEIVPPTTQVTRKYYITDDSGIRREVTELEFQREMGEMKINQGQTTITRHYYVTDSSTGNAVEIKNPDQYWHLQQDRVVQQQSQPLHTTTTEVTRKYFMTDNAGQRREVSDEEFRRQMEILKHISSQSHTVTRKYYYIDSTTRGYLQEISPEDYWQNQELFQPQTVEITRKYYITDSSGKRKEVTQAEFREYVIKSQTASSSSQMVRHYYIRENGVVRELRPEELEKFEQYPKSISQEPLGQESDDSDLTKQTEVFNVPQTNQSFEHGQEVDDSDLTQQQEEIDSGNQFGKVVDQPLGQEVDDSFLTQQQVEESEFGKPQSGRQIDDSDLTQQVQEPNWQSPVQQQVDLGKPLGQHIDDSGLSQQTEDVSDPIEPQISNHDIFESNKPLEKLEDLNRPIGQEQEPDQRLDQQRVVSDYPSQTAQQADLTSQALIDKLIAFNNAQHTGARVVEKPIDVTSDGAGYGSQQQVDLGQEEDQFDLNQQPIQPQYTPQSPYRPSGSYGSIPERSDLNQQPRPIPQYTPQTPYRPSGSYGPSESNSGIPDRSNLNQPRPIPQYTPQTSYRPSGSYGPSESNGRIPERPNLTQQPQPIPQYTPQTPYRPSGSYGPSDSSSGIPERSNLDQQPRPIPQYTSQTPYRPSGSYGPSGSYHSSGFNGGIPDHSDLEQQPIPQYTPLSGSYGTTQDQFDSSHQPRPQYSLPSQYPASGSYGSQSSHGSTQNQFDLDREPRLQYTPQSSYGTSGSYSRTNSYSQQPESRSSRQPISSSYNPPVQSGLADPENLYGQVHYGTPKQVNEQVETAPEFEEIQPLQQHATVVESGGLKNKIVKNPDVVAPVENEWPNENITEAGQITTPAPGFWSRVGNKIKSKFV